MGATRTFRFTNVRMAVDAEPDSEGMLYALECCVCGKRSPLAESPGPAEEWAPRHFAANPEHHTYRALESTPMKITFESAADQLQAVP
ncbi:hypothetical protein [Streptomyces aidingensis]|uniref:DUF7848 domain-containing protein n=1 Tax=Streptomyces aidingensis TaxID=910347 RepID=UPI0011149471|nr:hypothetical protein [Streptomyces aidingensis]